MSTEQQRAALSPPRPLKTRLCFERLPAAYCHPERLQRLLPDGLPTQFRDRLLASKRLRRRLSAKLTKHFALEACAPDMLATPAGRFAQLEGEALKDSLRRIGAVWHARTMRKFILAEPLRQLLDRLGRNTYRTALANIDLAPDVDMDETETDGRSPDIDHLVDRIERDGLLAVNAWCRKQPPALEARLRLKLPPRPEVDDEPPASHRERGPMIVDRLIKDTAYG